MRLPSAPVARRAGVLRDDRWCARNVKLLIQDQTLARVGAVTRLPQRRMSLTFALLRRLQDLHDAGHAVGVWTLTAAASAVLRHGVHEAVPRLFGHAVQCMKVKPDERLLSCLAASHARAGKAPLVWRVFDEEFRLAGAVATARTYNDCIAAAAAEGHNALANEAFQRMVKEKVEPDSMTYCHLISACRTTDAADTALGLVRKAMPANYMHYNAVLGVCVKCNDAATAEGIIHRMNHSPSPHARPNTASYTALMTVYKERGDFKKVVGVYNRMKRMTIAPNGATYIVFLGACQRMVERRTPHTQRYAGIALIALRQAVSEGVADAAVQAVGAHFVGQHADAAEAGRLASLLREMDVQPTTKLAEALLAAGKRKTGDEGLLDLDAKALDWAAYGKRDIGKEAVWREMKDERPGTAAAKDA